VDIGREFEIRDAFSASDSFTTMALYKFTYLLTYLNAESTRSKS